MKTLATALVPLLLGLLLVSSGIGCGGGGGGTTTPPTPTQLHGGTYFYQALSGNPGPPSALAWWGDYISNGAGTVTGGTLSVNNNSSLASAAIVPYAYTVDAARKMVWAAGGPTEHTGGLAADGRAAVLGATATAAFPTLAVTLRKGGTFSTASLTGIYHAFGCWRGGGSVGSVWGTANFNGAGTVTWSVTRNLNGVVGPAAYGPDTYTVAADGTVDVGFGSAELRGGMLAGGELAAATGNLNPAAPQLLMVFIRRATAAGLATFDGTYHLTFLNLDSAGPPDYITLTGDLTADGAGSLVIPAGAIINDDGAISTFAVGAPGAFTVGLDGTLVVSDLQGAVSPSGAFAALCGRTSGGGDSELWVMVR